MLSSRETSQNVAVQSAPAIISSFLPSVVYGLDFSPAMFLYWVSFLSLPPLLFLDLTTVLALFTVTMRPDCLVSTTFPPFLILLRRMRVICVPRAGKACLYPRTFPELLRYLTGTPAPWSSICCVPLPSTRLLQAFLLLDRLSFPCFFCLSVLF